MKRISKKDLARIKEIDILTYFKNYAPNDLVRNGRNDSYYLKSHDSLKISNEMWYWWSQNIGGKSALDYLIKVESYEFKEAVNYLNELLKEYPPVKQFIQDRKIRTLQLPMASDDTTHIEEYLINVRGLDKGIIHDLIQQKYIYEDKLHHYVIFVGKNEFGIPMFATKRSLISNYKQECLGSNKAYSFKIENNKEHILHIFESAIDLISYITILKMEHKEYQDMDYLSLSGVSNHSEGLPIPIIHYLENHPDTKTIYLHLDNDIAGRNATNNLIEKLSNAYEVIDEPASKGKDFNDDLINLKKI